ncbi:MAG: hypothetical protein ACOCQ2_01815 [Halanaerobiales bacterium]
MKENWKSKKQKIIDFVKNDPFLKIDELAKLADTTTKYVRTTLSEANISLMKMRKKYVRKIEGEGKSQQFLFTYLIENSLYKNDKIKDVSELILNNPQDLNYFFGDFKENYIYKFFKHSIGEMVWSISGIFVPKTYEEILKNTSNLSNNKLYNLKNELKAEEIIDISNINIEIERAIEPLAGSLGIKQMSSVFKITQFIKLKEDKRLLLLAYFPSDRVNLSLSDNRGLIINKIIS